MIHSCDLCKERLVFGELWVKVQLGATIQMNEDCYDEERLESRKHFHYLCLQSLSGEAFLGSFVNPWEAKR